MWSSLRGVTPYSAPLREFPWRSLFFGQEAIVKKSRGKFQPLWDDRATAHFIHASRAVLRKWRSEKKGPTYIRVGHLIRYRPVAVESWLASRTVETREQLDAVAEVSVHANPSTTPEIEKCPK
jgi:hypothetical protein